MRPDRDHTLIARNLDSSIPLFRVSNTTGQGIELLTDFLCALPLDISRWQECQNDNSEFLLGEHFMRKGQEIILSGMMLKGSLSKLQTVLMGPNSIGRF